MVNKNDVWSSGDALDAYTLEVQDRGFGFMAFNTDCSPLECAVLSMDQVRELRDWLTAKLEGDDDNE